MDRRAEQHSQPLGCKVMGEDRTGTVPGVWGTQATRITLVTLLCLPSVKGLILADTRWWFGAEA